MSTMYWRRPTSARATSPSADDRAAVLARAQDDVLVLARLGERRLRDDGERELDRSRVRLLTDLAGAEELRSAC